jgi:hypothetical protein
VSEECETQFQRDKLLIGCKIEEKRRGKGNGMEGVGVNEGRSLPCPTCHVVSCSAVCYA